MSHSAFIHAVKQCQEAYEHRGPTAILTHHSVPYGRTFRQWDTDGHLFVWVNQGEIADLEQRAWRGDGPLFYGIPVVRA